MWNEKKKLTRATLEKHAINRKYCLNKGAIKSNIIAQSFKTSAINLKLSYVSIEIF